MGEVRSFDTHRYSPSSAQEQVHHILRTEIKKLLAERGAIEAAAFADKLMVVGVAGKAIRSTPPDVVERINSQLDNEQTFRAADILLTRWIEQRVNERREIYVKSLDNLNLRTPGVLLDPPKFTVTSGVVTLPEGYVRAEHPFTAYMAKQFEQEFGEPKSIAKAYRAATNFRVYAEDLRKETIMLPSLNMPDPHPDDDAPDWAR